MGQKYTKNINKQTEYKKDFSSLCILQEIYLCLSTQKLIMKLKDIVSISGKPGLFKLVQPRKDGLIVSPVGEDKRTFVSSRKHNFTPLENIGIYMNSGDTVELSKVMQLIKEKKNVPLSTATKDELQDFFSEVLPDYDKDMVHYKDMKKMIQWLELLTPYQLFSASDEEE